jgi:hypothetical protein
VNAPVPGRPGGSQAFSHASWLPAKGDEVSEYRELETAFLRQGGLAGADAVTELMRPCMDQSISRLARWIVDGEVLSVQWGSRLLVPLFQFDRFSMLPRPAVGEVIRELAPVRDDWSLALWFARPNPLLGWVAPVDLIQDHPEAVVDAARDQRLLLRG